MGTFVETVICYNDLFIFMQSSHILDYWRLILNSTVFFSKIILVILNVDNFKFWHENLAYKLLQQNLLLFV